MDPREAVAKLVSTDVTAGILNPEQVETFYTQIFDAIPFSGMVRKERKRAKTGELDKMLLGTRLLRAKTEGPTSDDGYRVAPTFDKLEYTCVRMKLPWEVSEDTYHDNIEGEGMEDKLMGLLTTQLALDLEDLHFNGDGTTAPFLSLNTGWVAQAVAGGHTVDATAINGGVIDKDHFFAAKAAMPVKYTKSGRMRWVMNSTTQDAWVQAVSDRATSAGDNALLGAANQAPLGIPIVQVPALDDGVVMLVDPQNFIVVNTWDVRIRKAAEGKSAIMNDMRYYTIFLDDDCVIEELDAVVIIEDMTLS
jgi:HK97 family phage major capsid protein